LVIIAVISTAWFLQWARDLLIPLMLGIQISYTLSPFVNGMHRRRIPRAAGAAVLLAALLGATGALTYSLGDEAAAVIRTLPDATENFRRALKRPVVASAAAIDDLQKAASQLERAPSESGVQSAPAPRGVTRVQIEQPLLKVQDFLRVGTMRLITLVSQATLVLFLVFFVLTAGDAFRRKLVRITGPALSRRKNTVQILDEITSQIQRYLLVRLVTSILVGVATWLAFLALEVQHAAIWGISAAVFNTVPYIGPAIVTAGAVVVALLQFHTAEMAVLTGGVALLITSIEGFLITPWLSGKASRMNPVAIFVGLLVWGWLWGVWGLLLGMPIIIMIKAICDRVEGLTPIGELLGE
jgi:predicted PurR-regulated permease PerM